MDGPAVAAANVAATLAQGLIGALTQIWQYYIAVVLGVIAFVAAISAGNIPLTLSSKLILTAAMIVFAVVNFRSVRGVTKQLNELAVVIKAGTPALSKALAEDLGTSVLWVHPIGLLLPTIWLWISTATK